jgi:pyridoxamine 5'-phosphate oxidase
MPPLRRADLDPDPLAQAARWLAEARAAGCDRPQAMALATADAGGRASVRMVFVRALTPAGAHLLTDLESPKARDAAATGRGALAAWWAPLGRQLRLEGTLGRADPATEAALLAGWGREGRRAAWAGRQGAEVAGRPAVEGDPPPPPWFGALCLVPDHVEVWQESPDRLHDRFAYRRVAGGWTLTRLAP